MMPPRLAVRAAILKDDRLLLVNAYPGRRSDLWCLPGGGVEPGQSLPQNLIREVAEETGLSVTVSAPILVNEFYDPDRGFHQIEIIFRAALDCDSPIVLGDPEGVVNRIVWATRADLRILRHKPGMLAKAVWGAHAAWYDPLERIVG